MGVLMGGVGGVSVFGRIGLSSLDLEVLGFVVEWSGCHCGGQFCFWTLLLHLDLLFIAGVIFVLHRGVWMVGNNDFLLFVLIEKIDFLHLT
jgi:hypothetical protein